MADPEAVREEYRRKLLQYNETKARLRSVQENVKVAKEFDKMEDDLKASQNVDQTTGEVLRQLDSDRCNVIVKSSSDPLYVVEFGNNMDKEKLVAGTRVVIDMTTLTSMRALPRDVSLVI